MALVSLIWNGRRAKPQPAFLWRCALKKSCQDADREWDIVVYPLLFPEPQTQSLHSHMNSKTTKVFMKCFFLSPSLFVSGLPYTYDSDGNKDKCLWLKLHFLYPQYIACGCGWRWCWLRSKLITATVIYITK